MVDKMRLIDADALMDAFNESDRDSALADYVFNTVVNVIHMSPTVDAVEVVRCKDCKWWDGKHGLCWREEDVPTAFEFDDFCSYGERSER